MIIYFKLNIKKEKHILNPSKDIKTLIQIKQLPNNKFYNKIRRMIIYFKLNIKKKNTF